MLSYRIYRVSREGHFVGVIEVMAASDEGALVEARKLIDGRDLEVWRANEKIAYLKGVRSKSEHPDASAGPESSNADHPDIGR